MSWSRTAAVAALVSALNTAAGNLPDGSAGTVFVFPSPPDTVNPPAIVVGRPTQVLYGTAALGIDEATLPVLVVAELDGEDTIDGLIHTVRQALKDPMLGGAVQNVYAEAERNWSNLNVAGADLLQAEVTLIIQM
jgi:hypothetical protein